MPTDQLAVLEELSGGRLYSSAIFGTYKFDGAFFEEEILPILNQLDITNIVVLTDTQAYTETTVPTQAGKAYYIDHVRCSGIYHPKFVALFGHDYGRAFIGSANLTEQGWQQSGELMTVVDHSGDSDGTAPLFARLREFIEQSVTHIHSSRATAAINEAFRDAPWLPQASATTSDEQLQFLYNYGEPLLSQVLGHVGDRSIEEIEIYSPFFGGTDEAPFATLCDVDPERIAINLQPDRVEGFDAGVLDASCFDGIDVTVNKIALTDDDADRYLHAKLLLLKGPAGAWAFYGSPNFTTPALLKTGATGNIELGVLRHESDLDYFDYLLDSETVTREAIDPESVTYRPPSSTDEADGQPDFYLTDAYLETDGTLVIEHEEATPSRATLHLRRAAEDPEIDIEISNPSDGQLRCQDERIPQLCRQSVQVEVTLEFPDSVQTSDARWVALPKLEQTPRRSEVQTVENSEGRDGLLEVLNRLPTWGLICEFLQNVDFESMDIEGGARQIGGRGPGADNGGGMEEWDPKTRDEILDEKTTALLDRIEATREALILDPTDPERVESLVNQYVAMAKLVLWWESQEPDELSHLAKVRRATQIIGRFIERLSRCTDQSAARAIEEEYALLEHSAIIMCYVDALHRQAGYDSGSNQNVYVAFRNTNRTVLEAFGGIREQPVPTTARLQDCIDEYSAIEAVSLSAKRVEFYCDGLIDTAE